MHHIYNPRDTDVVLHVYYQFMSLQTVFPSSEDTIIAFAWRESASEQFYVDDSIQVLKISIKTTGAEDDADFIYPDGTSIICFSTESL